MRRSLALRGTLALASLFSLSPAMAADHLDAPAVKADPAADITDVYSWVDGSNVVLVMNVFPVAAAGSKFSDKVQYVFHTESTATFGMPGTKVDVICTFDAAQMIQCWVGTADYVKGDASVTGGLASASGKVKVFAGLRDDPFFFNLEGFNDTVGTFVAAAPAIQFDSTGCPMIDAATSAVVVGMLKSTAKGTMPATDFFATLNVLSIVVSVDKTLLTGGGPQLSVWASTNKGGN